MNTVALIVAAGRGIRAGGSAPKQYRHLAGEAVLTRTIRAVLASDKIDHVMTVIHRDDHGPYDAAVAEIDDQRLLPPVIGGVERAQSVRLGLEALTEVAPDHVLIHDAARPFITAPVIEAIIAKLTNHDGAMAAVPVVDALWRGGDGFCVDQVDRSGLWRAQTPQGFGFTAILAAHQTNTDPKAADDAAIARAAGLDVALIEASTANFKITNPADFARAERQIMAHAAEYRTGQGYDVHALVEGDGVILCGIKIPFHRSLSGHSDADVAMHALTDAIFGALAEGDIGRWFPPSDMRWKGAKSSIFLEKAIERVTERKGRLINCDLTIICEQPKITPHAETMIASLAAIMAVDPDRISVKATTSERLGFTGREEGIAAMATATVALS
ncbi:MAG: bifunctional 2-C-methyl-D-erythritol 4-phosphate cytidylyltransferase/2-C-methyl-D-erythritol 2,4-cyclodiphosphate synthase [Pseudomonadota bacterium]